MNTVHCSFLYFSSFILIIVIVPSLILQCKIYFYKQKNLQKYIKKIMGAKFVEVDVYLACPLPNYAHHMQEHLLKCFQNFLFFRHA